MTDIAQALGIPILAFLLAASAAKRSATHESLRVRLGYGLTALGALLLGASVLPSISRPDSSLPRTLIYSGVSLLILGTLLDGVDIVRAVLSRRKRTI